MKADKLYCMSSYLAFRYIEDPEKCFYDSIKQNRVCFHIADEDKVYIYTFSDIDQAISRQFEKIKTNRLGLLLSGGMDSAILASYMPGCDAYTFRFMGGAFQHDEMTRAEYYAETYGLRLHYIDIGWDVIEKHIDAVMNAKGAPVHSIEPQILHAALQAKADGIELMVIGDCSDYIFGGFDKLCSRDWLFDDFVKRYMYIDPKDVLCEPKDMTYLFERYRVNDHIDFVRLINESAEDESLASYSNAFFVAKLPYYDPYEMLKMAEPLDLTRVRNGESKYLIRELFSTKYPNIAIPNKNPMPRLVDYYFANWNGPVRPEFKKDLKMTHFSGDQKWQLWCLERFLNLHEPLLTSENSTL